MVDKNNNSMLIMGGASLAALAGGLLAFPYIGTLGVLAIGTIALTTIAAIGAMMNGGGIAETMTNTGNLFTHGFSKLLGTDPHVQEKLADAGPSLATVVEVGVPVVGVGSYALSTWRNAGPKAAYQRVLTLMDEMKKPDYMPNQNDITELKDAAEKGKPYIEKAGKRSWFKLFPAEHKGLNNEVHALISEKEAILKAEIQAKANVEVAAKQAAAKPQATQPAVEVEAAKTNVVKNIQKTAVAEPSAPHVRSSVIVDVEAGRTITPNVGTQKPGITFVDGVEQRPLLEVKTAAPEPVSVAAATKPVVKAVAEPVSVPNSIEPPMNVKIVAEPAPTSAAPRALGQLGKFVQSSGRTLSNVGDFGVKWGGRVLLPAAVAASGYDVITTKGNYWDKGEGPGKKGEKALQHTSAFAVGTAVGTPFGGPIGMAAGGAAGYTVDQTVGVQYYQKEVFENIANDLKAGHKTSGDTGIILRGNNISDYKHLDAERSRIANFIPGGKIDGKSVAQSDQFEEIDMTKPENIRVFEDGLKKAIAYHTDKMNENKVWNITRNLGFKPVKSARYENEILNLAYLQSAETELGMYKSQIQKDEAAYQKYKMDNENLSKIGKELMADKGLTDSQYFERVALDVNGDNKLDVEDEKRIKDRFKDNPMLNKFLNNFAAKGVKFDGSQTVTTPDTPVSTVASNNLEK